MTVSESRESSWRVLGDVVGAVVSALVPAPHGAGKEIESVSPKR